LLLASFNYSNEDIQKIYKMFINFSFFVNTKYKSTCKTYIFAELADNEFFGCNVVVVLLGLFFALLKTLSDTPENHQVVH